MSGKSPGLEARIAAEIESRGPLGFDRFMALALYDPSGGYYGSGENRIGKSGDYYTNVSVGPIYGEILAGQIVEMWEALGRPDGFSVIEQGANDGRLARDILDALEKTPLDGTAPRIVEPNPALRRVQAETLRGRKAEWYSSIDELPVAEGVHFSNELFDAFPVRVVRSDGAAWNELLVGFEGGKFCWKEFPLSGEPGALASALPRRPAGFTAEICDGFGPFFASLSRKISRGFVLAVDYGMTSEELMSEHRRGGTFRCFKGHRADSDPLDEPGAKDITAHVDFTRLAIEAARAGWTLEKFADQHHFLVGAATRLLLELNGSPNPGKLRPLMTLLHPESMGRQFRAILFSKGVAPGLALSGFRHARDADLPDRWPAH